MQVIRYSELHQLVPQAGDWDRLGQGVPFRSWVWASNWWRTYGLSRDGSSQSGKELYVLAVLDENGRLAGIAPWWIQGTAAQGSTLRILGSGEVCSDYLSVLCHRSKEEAVAAALAEWLTRAACSPGRDRWDSLVLEGVDSEDRAIQRLTEELAKRGHTVHSRPGLSCWRIELPASWDEYLARLSKDHRKQLRRAERIYLTTGRARLHTVTNREELELAWHILLDLHQRRHRELGEPGCFNSEPFASFHANAMPELLDSGWLDLHWVELDGRPTAAEYYLVGGNVVYAYQAGIEPELLDHGPGRLANMMTIRRAIERGYRAFDFLRGDEPYKAHWRAQARASIETRVIPTRVSAQIRHGVWLAGAGMKQWLKGGIGLFSGNP